MVKIQQKPKEFFKNGYHALHDLLEQLDITNCSRSARSFLEWMGNENKKNSYPTNNDIVKIRRISYDHAKRITSEFKNSGLITALGTKGHNGSDRLALANILVEEDLELAKSEAPTEEQMAMDIAFVKSFLNEGENYSIHNIHLLAYLKDPAIYKAIKSEGKNVKNQGKLFNTRLHVNRRFAKIIFYPNGTVDIIISCSDNPYGLTTTEGIANFQSALGRLYEQIVNITDNPDPLTTEPAGWEYALCDINIDYPISSFENKMGKRGIDWSPGGRFKIKDLSYLYQIYAKTTVDGKVIRFEERKKFPPNQKRITVKEMEMEYRNKQIDNALESLGIKNLEHNTH